MFCILIVCDLKAGLGDAGGPETHQVGKDGEDAARSGFDLSRMAVDGMHLKLLGEASLAARRAAEAESGTQATVLECTQTQMASQPGRKTERAARGKEQLREMLVKLESQLAGVEGTISEAKAMGLMDALVQQFETQAADLRTCKRNLEKEYDSMETGSQPQPVPDIFAAAGCGMMGRSGACGMPGMSDAETIDGFTGAHGGQSVRGMSPGDGRGMTDGEAHGGQEVRGMSPEVARGMSPGDGEAVAEVLPSALTGSTEPSGQKLAAVAATLHEEKVLKAAAKKAAQDEAKAAKAKDQSLTCTVQT